MMAPTIRVDDEVYAALQAEAKAFVDTPNTVLRRKFGLEAEAAGSTASAAPMTQGGGRMWVLLQAGVLSVNDGLHWKRSQRGLHHPATVREDGGLVLANGMEFDTPSGAARHLAGYEVNGWRSWRHDLTGKTLDELWTEYEATLS